MILTFYCYNDYQCDQFRFQCRMSHVRNSNVGGISFFQLQKHFLTLLITYCWILFFFLKISCILNHKGNRKTFGAVVSFKFPNKLIMGTWNNFFAHNLSVQNFVNRIIIIEKAVYFVFIKKKLFDNENISHFIINIQNHINVSQENNEFISVLFGVQKKYFKFYE